MEGDCMRVDNYGQVARVAVSSASDIRADKVARLKAAIEEGTYSVSGKDIADKLVEGYFAVY